MRALRTGLVALALPVIAIVPAASALAETLTVTPSNLQGWVLNGDPTTATPYEFSEDQASIGEGSLFVPPIGTNASDKFIAAKTVDVTVPNYDSTSYDFLIAGDGTTSDAQQFYLNVYTKIAGPTAHPFYNCRFDYVPTVGSTTDFTTASFAATSTPTRVADRAGDGFTCPATLAELPSDSTVSLVTVNVGDTGTSDAGLAGYLDNIVIAASDDVTTYDFEQDPMVLTNKDACKNGGWMASEAPVFKNQGSCVSSFTNNSKNR